MAIGMKVGLRNDRIELIKTAIDAGSGAGTLKIYSGTRPATGAAITTQTLLATLTFSDPCGTITADTGVVLTFSVITSDTSADADGTASWARIADSDGNFVLDLDVGASSDLKEITLNTTTIVAGGEVGISLASITEGNA